MTDTLLDPEVTPQYKHLRKQASELAASRKLKKDKKILKTEYEMVMDSRGRKKYRKIVYTPTAKFSSLISPKSAEIAHLTKNKKSKVS